MLKNKKLRYAAWIAASIVATLLSSLWISRLLIQGAASGKTFNSISAIPHNKVGLVLGCSRYLRDGRINRFFKYRMDAAAELYAADKVDYLLVSGDNRRVDYNEPQMMKKALLERGVPAERIVCDYAGFSTLDSIVRAKQVFCENEFTIVSQQFHNERALYIAQSRRLNAIAYNARDVEPHESKRTRLREAFARVKTILDVKLLNRQPTFLGDPILIGPERAEEIAQGM